MKRNNTTLLSVTLPLSPVSHRAKSSQLLPPRNCVGHPPNQSRTSVQKSIPRISEIPQDLKRVLSGLQLGPQPIDTSLWRVRTNHQEFDGSIIPMFYPIFRVCRMKTGIRDTSPFFGHKHPILMENLLRIVVSTDQIPTPMSKCSCCFMLALR